MYFPFMIYAAGRGLPVGIAATIRAVAEPAHSVICAQIFIIVL